MAVWGGLAGTPTTMPAAAMRAALAIARVIREDNADAPRRRRGADPRAHRPAFRSGGGRQYRRAGPGQLHGGRRHGERRAALRAARQGVHEAGGEEIVVLASGATVAAVKDRAALGIELPPPELRRVKGHDEPVEVYRLV